MKSEDFFSVVEIDTTATGCCNNGPLGGSPDVAISATHIRILHLVARSRIIGKPPSIDVPFKRNKMVDDPSFDELLAQLESGDQGAATKVFERYAERLVALARGRLKASLRSKVDAEDIV
jgi:hypothetical protein